MNDKSIVTGDKVQLGPFVGVVEEDTFRNWLNIYLYNTRKEPIGYEEIVDGETPYQALASWLQVDNIVTDMLNSKLIRDYDITYF